MTSIAGEPLRYLIGKDNDPGASGMITVVGYHTSAVPTNGKGAGYVNRRKEEGGRVDGEDYIDPPDDIEQEYGEPAHVFGSDDFFKNIDSQCIRLRDLGFTIVEIDNLDTDNVEQALELLDYVSGTYGFEILVKNPNFVEGDSKRLVAHPFGIGMICEHDDEVTAKALDDLRRSAGQASEPIRVVTYGDEQLEWAYKIADEAQDLKLIDFGVTSSTIGEYKSVTHILRPVMSSEPSPITNPKPWNATLESDIGRFHDGPDVPMLATQTARVWPDDEGMAKYVTMAGNGTAWCGIFCAWKLSRWSIRPPLKDHGVGGFMYVDAWKDFGTSVDPAQRQDGDLALWWKPGSPPHHIAFCWEGKYLGGNQNNTVNISNFRTPDSVRRPPAPESYTPQPEQMPMLMIESSGDAVRTLQTMLNEQIAAGLVIDGEFGEATETAVKNYQTRYSLEADGIVGPQTWESLFDHDKPALPVEPELLTSDQIVGIMNLARDSSIANYQWKQRGKAPIGMTQGLAVLYGECVLKLAANDSAVIAMSNAIGSHSKDALAYYGIEAVGRENVLRKLFVMLYGLAMRESSGNYTEGRDVTASNVTADTCEAGLYQQSWNSSNASSEMKKLLPAYQGNKQPCHAAIFKQGITQKATKSFGSGPGFEFQELAKSCPAFAVMMCGVGLRVLYNHWGPIVRKESEFRAEAEALLLKVASFVAEAPEPEPPTDEIAEAKARCMHSIEAAVDRLITDLTGAKVSRSIIVQPTRASEPVPLITPSGRAMQYVAPVGDVWPVEVREEIAPEQQQYRDIGEAIFDTLIERLARSKQP